MKILSQGWKIYPFWILLSLFSGVFWVYTLGPKILICYRDLLPYEILLQYQLMAVFNMCFIYHLCMGCPLYGVYLC